MSKMYENGKLREMTQEEIEKTTTLPPPEPTPEDRMNEIEAALIELAAMLTGGM